MQKFREEITFHNKSDFTKFCRETISWLRERDGVPTRCQLWSLVDKRYLVDSDNTLSLSKVSNALLKGEGLFEAVYSGSEIEKSAKYC